MSFDFRPTIRHCLSQQATKSAGRDSIKNGMSDNSNIFDAVVRAIESHFSRKVGDMKELKERESKKKKGDAWEEFCVEWLKASGRYKHVWKWSEVPDDVRDLLGLVKRQDNGIDLVCKRDRKYIPVQCKYRRKGNVTWTVLSTFIAMCNRTGPWSKRIVMTNCKSINWKGNREEDDFSWCCGTFRKTSREMWLTIAGVENKGHILTGAQVIQQQKTPREVTINDLRQLRVNFYDQLFARSTIVEIPTHGCLITSVPTPLTITRFLAYLVVMYRRQPGNVPPSEYQEYLSSFYHNTKWVDGQRIKVCDIIFTYKQDMIDV